MACTTCKVFTERNEEGMELAFLPDSGSLSQESSGNYVSRNTANEYAYKPSKL